MNKKVLLQAAILALSITSVAVLKAEDAKPASQKVSHQMHSKKDRSMKKMEKKAEKMTESKPVTTPAQTVK